MNDDERKMKIDSLNILKNKTWQGHWKKYGKRENEFRENDFTIKI